MRLRERLRAFGLEKERVAVSLLSLSCFVVLYVLAALSAPEAWRPALLALALCYAVGFLALASQWFWSRWYASGLAWSGASLGLLSLVMVGWHPMLALYGGLHALVLVMLSGPRMAACFEMQAPWRERYALDEFGVAKLQRVVTRSAAALPSLILWALAPREEQGLWLISGLAVACALAGLTGILRLRTWGVLGVGFGGVLTLTGLVLLPPTSLAAGAWAEDTTWTGALQAGAIFAAGLLLAAIIPLAKPIGRAWRARSQ